MPLPAEKSLVEILADWVSRHIETTKGRPPVLFVSGAQGSGKSTALRQLVERSPLRLTALGIDDFYLTRDERRHLARTVHPLFETRGPPGTHALPLLLETLEKIKTGAPSAQVATPVFDKANDDRAPRNTWTLVPGRPDAILVEGWLMGALPDPNAPTSPPLNTIEARDQDGYWRQYQEDQLAGPYAELWDSADGFFHIEAPDFGVVFKWRLQQEAETLNVELSDLNPQTHARISQFIQYFERITRRMLAGQIRPGRSVHLDAERRVNSNRSSAVRTHH